MDTNSLRLFVLAAREKNISAAGRAVGMAPAVASAHLARLEKHLGVDLLHRSTRKVALSIEGADFLPFAKAMLEQEAAGLAALGHGTTEATGTLRFAAPSTFAQLYICPLLPEFRAKHPGIILDLRLSDTRQDLIEGSFDLALRNGPLQDTSLKGRKLADDQRVLCAAPEYLAQHGTPKTPGDLTNHNLIAFKDRAARDLVSADHHAMFDPKNAKLIFDDGASQRIATLAGAGISANSLWSIQPDLTTGRLTRVLPDYHIKDGAVLWLVYPKSTVLTAKVRLFIDFLLDGVGPALPKPATPG